MKNRYKIALVLCQKYVVFYKQDFKTDRLELSISVNRAC